MRSLSISGRKTRWFVWTVLVIGLSYMAYKMNYPDYVYRYRLELTLEVDGKPHTGSSVIEVKWIGAPAIFLRGPFSPELLAYSANPHVYGQAPLIDLGDRGILIASLAGGDLSFPNQGFSAQWLCARAFGSDNSYDKLPKLPQLTGRRDLTPDNWPLLVLLSDRSNPASVSEVTSSEVERVFGKGARFASAFVEITTDPIVIDIDKKLPWYRAWADEYRRQVLVYGSLGKISLSPNMLVGND